jgi:hypothetical protein
LANTIFGRQYKGHRKHWRNNAVPVYKAKL